MKPSPTAIEKAQLRLQEMREAGISTERRNPFEKLREKPSRKTAIDAMCAMCMGCEEGGEMAPRYKENIRECTSLACPLYGFRPYKKEGEK